MNPMVVQCLSCHTEFELDPAKVPAQGVRARCSVCSAVINVPRPVVVPSVTQAPDVSRTATPVSIPAASFVPSIDATPPAPPPVAPSAPPSRVETPVAVPVRPPVEPHQPVARPTPTSMPAWSTPIAGVPTVADHSGVQKRPINPFLSKDPSLRAKRLARALISDIVAYHPAKHAEGLRDGTLKTLFRDEIKKSYEEYVDQVGRGFAESSAHFSRCAE